MKRTTCRLSAFSILAMTLITLTGCQGVFGPISPKNKITLWNGRDFSGWKLVVADKNVDVDDVWSVRKGVVYCIGKPNGYMRTKARYSNYRLHVEWRWPENPTNSGVFLHAGGKDKVWPRTIECQLKAGSAGDFVLINGPGITVDGENKQNTEKQFVGIAKKQQSTEKPAGEWNTYDIHCEGGSIRCFVNGILQNVGTDATDTSGWICLQSEGGPIEFRNIYIEPLN